ncbi:hypothetical protein EVAR_26007_1 [Eumeta japonica]|uniref:Uncharacterized protein n=1 Tax=Eumeta variegata TaxID=151549 RepID=A0A4C1VRD1_EUMVA|nr:hypothetical protein EVAR_26007_1 [Eumeta japonica]
MNYYVKTRGSGHILRLVTDWGVNKTVGAYAMVIGGVRLSAKGRDGRTVGRPSRSGPRRSQAARGTHGRHGSYAPAASARMFNPQR